MASILENVGNFLNKAKNRVVQGAQNVQSAVQNDPNRFNVFGNIPQLYKGSGQAIDSGINAIQNNPLSRKIQDVAYNQIQSKPNGAFRNIVLPSLAGSANATMGALSLISPSAGRIQKQNMTDTNELATRFKIPQQVPLLGGQSIPQLAGSLAVDPTNYIPPIGKVAKTASFAKKAATLIPNIAVNAGQGFIQPAENNSERLTNTAVSAGLGLAIPTAVAGTKAFVKAGKETVSNLATDTYRAARNDIIKNAATNPNYRPFRNMFDALEKVPQLRQVAESPAMMSDISKGNQVIDFVRQQLPKIKVDSEVEARKIVRYVADLYDGKSPREVPTALKGFDKSLKTAGGRFVGQAGSIKIGGFDESNVDLKGTTKLPPQEAQRLSPQQGAGVQSIQQASQDLPMPPKSSQDGSLPDSNKPFTNPEDPYFNVNRLNVDNNAKEFAKNEIEGLKPQVEKVTGGKMSNQSVVELASSTSEIKRKVIGEDRTKSEIANNLKVRQELSKMAQDGKATKEFIDTFLQAKSYATDTARKLQALSINADPREQTAINAILEAVYKVNKNSDEIAKAAEGIDFNNAQQAAEFYRTFIKPKTSEYLDLIRYNSMLSSPATHITNIASNAISTAVLAPIEKVVSGTFDFLSPNRIIKGKERTMFAGEGGAYAKGYYSKLGEASTKFVDSLTGKNFNTNPDIELRDIPLFTKGKKAQFEKALRTPTRLLEASDQFFTALTEGGEKAALKYRQSKGVNIVDSAIDKQAYENAQYRLFRSPLKDPRQGKVLDSIDEVTAKIQGLRNSDNEITKTIANFVFPFVRTPMNILKQGVEFSPAGVTTVVGAANKTEQLAKAAIGSSAMLATALLVTSGNTTWAEPTSDTQKQAFKEAGMQPYSIRIGDKWIAYNKLPPQLSFPIAYVTSLHDAVKNQVLTQGDLDSILTATAKYGKFFADQSYLKNIGDGLAAIQGDPERFASFVGNYPQQLVPFRALGGWIARLSDPYQRQVNRDQSFWDQQVQQLMLSVPGASQSVDARLDSNGDPIPNQNREFNALSPFKVTNANKDAEANYKEIKADSLENKNDKAVSAYEESGGDPSRLKPSMLQELFGGKQAEAATSEGAVKGTVFKYKDTNGTKKTKKEFDTTPIPNGGSLADIKNRQDRTRDAVELVKDSELFDSGSKLKEAQIKDIINKTGLDYETIKYKAIDSIPQTDKAEIVYKMISDADEKTFNKMVESKLLTSDLITEMNKQGIVSDQEARTLKAQLKGKSTGTGGISKAKKIAGLKKLASIKLPRTKKITYKKPSLKGVDIKVPELRANVQKIAFKKSK